MTDGGAFHRSFHGARTAAGAAIKTTQPQLVTHALALGVILSADGMTTPANRNTGLDTAAQDLRVTKHVKNCIGNTVSIFQIETAHVVNL